MPVILKVTQYNTTTDSNGLASIVAAGGDFSPPVEVDVLATAGTNAVLNDSLLIFPPPSNGNGSPVTKLPVMLRPIRGALLRDKTAAEER
jgi:hypothetical protein